ncbi:MAG: hypothetical protein JKY70_21915 [Mucilaginibacter sp.]|nr:hypothetical protein [Mucilaginibacter sp.]
MAVKASIGFAATILTLITGFKKPTWGNWLTVFTILPFAMFLIAVVDK